MNPEQHAERFPVTLSQVDAESIVEECRARLQDASIEAVLMVAPEVFHGRSPLVYLFALLTEGKPNRIRWTSENATVELMALPSIALDTEIARGSQHYLIRRVARADVIYGSMLFGSGFRDRAKKRLDGPAPAVTPQTLSAIRGRASELLGEFVTVAGGDHASAGVVLASLVKTSVDCFFASRRLWAAKASDILRDMHAVEPASSNAVAAVLNSSLTSLCIDPSPVTSIVALLCGDQIEVRNDETRRQGSPRPLSSRIAAHAVRSYAGVPGAVRSLGVG
jgi:hypothetical protein